MKKINFNLTEKQDEKLRLLSEETGLSISDIIRRALDNLFASVENKTNVVNSLTTNITNITK